MCEHGIRIVLKIVGLLGAILWMKEYCKKKRSERLARNLQIIKPLLTQVEDIALETSLLFTTIDRLVEQLGEELGEVVSLDRVSNRLYGLADRSTNLVVQVRQVIELLKKGYIRCSMSKLAQSYEREIDAIRPYVLKIRQDLKVAEALAQVSLLTSPAARRRLAVRSLQLGRDPEQGPTEEYEPPKDILLYLVRMGSFNSAPKILNDDHQDRSLSVPASMSRLEFMDFCARERCNSFQLLRRPFLLRDTPLTEHVRRMSLSEQPKTSEQNPNNFRVFQWNVLSQTLGQTNDSFVLCPEAALTWDFRKFHLIEEIIQNNADVICLQEVDHFEFLQKLLATQGYEGVFYPKPDSPCVYIEGNNGPDGCAIFYKKDKFECIAKDSKILEVWKVQSNQVAILVVLRSLHSQREVCVVTTHLKAKKGALLSRLRNEQGKDLLEFISAKAGLRPVIICGDFNAEPSEPVYKTVLSDTTLGLGSAYANFLTPGSETMEPEKSAENEVPYTTWKVREEGEVCHTIDYIFYSQQHLEVDGILGVPSPEDVGEGKVPSYHYPSDHFSLVCDFSFKPSHQSNDS